MIEGIEAIYQRIADSVVEQLPVGWTSARVDAVFFADSSDYVGEYASSSGRSVDFEITMEVTRGFKELRRKFKESGKPLWGQASFELHSDGKFNMKWGYNNCDENGNTIWDEQEWHRRQEERRNRLSST
jgi:hypothetical protein